MKNNSLEAWLPCQSCCQMNGAAAAVLSFQDTTVVLNGPSWCSLVVERELMASSRSLRNRLYCSHVEQPDLLFGTGDKIRDFLDELERGNRDTGLLAVLTSCSVGLIGDDVPGIVGSRGQKAYPVIALDAGGLTGLFEEGYQAAMTAVLEKAELKRSGDIHPGRVNLLGYCGYYPDSSGDLAELKRLLVSAGFEPGVCPGEHGLVLRDLQKIPSAALNIVLSPELGLQTAKYLKETIGQDYAVLPVPYGLRQTAAWLENIGKCLSVRPDMTKPAQEMLLMQENIAEEIGALKRFISNLTFKRAVLALPRTQALALADALRNGILEVEDIQLHIQGNAPEADDPAQEEAGTVHTGSNGRKQAVPESSRSGCQGCDDYEGWLPSDYQLLFGTFADRSRTGNYAHTIYFNMHKADGILRRKYRTFAGIEGWGCLIHETVEQALTLYLLQEERRLPL